MIDNHQKIETAPRDGTLIIVGDADVGEFPMRWEPEATNPFFPLIVGFWVMSDGSMTWNDQDGAGPTYWYPIDK